MAELTTLLPASGGEYEFLSAAGDTLGRPGDFVSFLYVWVRILMGDPLSAALQGLGFASYALRLVYPSCEPPYAVTVLVAVSFVYDVTRSSGFGKGLALDLGYGPPALWLGCTGCAWSDGAGKSGLSFRGSVMSTQAAEPWGQIHSAAEVSLVCIDGPGSYGISDGGKWWYSDREVCGHPYPFRQCMDGWQSWVLNLGTGGWPVVARSERINDASTGR
ncbi:hypothetical protein HPB48_018800 [Haemaphysalis longicornis]|uniref:Uncharacterized protein n=1 Tax=Haemaphysalis longicornis TaxID=44386 RepID=A0A9J6GZW8_HAELO|nr:hypothetical protein HPB48_018800 [Haemaphysalis longicornis]